MGFWLLSRTMPCTVRSCERSRPLWARTETPERTRTARTQVAEGTNRVALELMLTGPPSSGQPDAGRNWYLDVQKHAKRCSREGPKQRHHEQKDRKSVV